MNPFAPERPSPELTLRLVALNRAQITQQLLRGIAHELRNNLQVVALGASLTGSGGSLSVSARVDGALDNMVAALDLLTRLGRGDPQEPSETDLGAALDEAVAFAGMQRHLPDLTLTVDRPPGIVLVGMPRFELTQVLVNLVTNARETGAPAADPVVLAGTMAMEGRAAITVTDCGPGIRPPAGRAFASTKSPLFHGGIGLFVSRALVESRGGTLTWERRPAGGTEVRVLLPASGPS